MTWREFILEVYEKAKFEPGILARPDFRVPAASDEIDKLESQCHARLPTFLRGALLESNGVMQLLKIDDRDWFEDLWLLYPVEQMLNDNLIYRRDSELGHYAGPFQDLIVFANAGVDGILFAHSVMDGLAASEVVAWYPAELELRVLAPNLRDFLAGYLTQGIMI